MKKIIIANWKMAPSSLKEAKRIFNEIKKTAIKLSKVKTIICPPFVYLSELGHLMSKWTLNVRLGAQDLFYENPPAGGGAYTGEISAGMLKNLGVKYVIIGHSERRELGESNEVINKKIKTALVSGLKIIFCIGEKERDSEGEYLNFIKDQINEGLKGIPRKLFNPPAGGLIIAYEPVWAIGKKGKNADNPENVFQMSIYIRRALLTVVGGKFSRAIPVVYGGSVEPENAEKLLTDGGMQGFLVGHASLIPKDFNKILTIANKIK